MSTEKKPALAIKTANHKVIYSMLNPVTASTVEEMATQAGLDFEVEKRPMFLEGSEGINFVVPNHVAITKLGEYDTLGVVGRKYGIVQYMEMLRFTEILVSKDAGSYCYGSATNSGAKAYVVMKTNDCFSLAPGDDIECYFYIATSHDGSLALKVVPMPIRQSGGITIAHPGLSAFTIKHTTHVGTHMARAHKTLAGIKTYWTEFSKSFELLRSLNINDDQADKFLKMVLPNDTPRSENMRDKMEDIRKTNPALQVPSCKGTMLGALFAVLIHTDHYKTTRNTGKTDEKSAKINTLLDGAGARRKADAFGFALKMVDKFGKNKVL